MSGFSGWGCSGRRRKGLEDLNVYSTSAQQGVKVRKDLNFFASGVRFFIKVLSDLEHRPDTFSIDM